MSHCCLESKSPAPSRGGAGLLHRSAILFLCSEEGYLLELVPMKPTWRERPHAVAEAGSPR
jgi:hypothetical protein